MPCNRGKGKMYFGKYVRLVQSAAVPTPPARGRLRPPLDYQRFALTQVIDHLEASGVQRFKLSTLADLLPMLGLRDGVNPIFEPLSPPLVEEAFDQLVSEGRLVPIGKATDITLDIR